MSAKIDPEAVYCQSEICEALGITARRLGNAAVAGEVRFAALGSQRMFRGQWVLDWLEGRKPTSLDDVKTNP